MNRLDAMTRDIPESCRCRWRWLKSHRQWIRWQASPECPWHISVRTGFRG